MQKRPYPPENILGLEPEFDGYEFEPAPDVKKWIWETFIEPEGELYNEDHDHISAFGESFFEVLWASGGFIKGESLVLGQCEKVMFRAGGWQKARQELQMRNWFGHVPEYLITLDAQHCADCTDAEFCALVEHELYHIGVKRDEDGNMLVSRQTGEPKHYLRGHDVEEFHGIVQRYGANEAVQKMVELAKEGPTISKVSIAQACGTCRLKLA